MMSSLHLKSVENRRSASIDNDVHTPLFGTNDNIRGSTRWGWVTLAIAIAASIVGVVLVRRQGAIGLFGDEASHLLHARRVMDSATPGFGQIGQYWPPLFQILELPFVWIDGLYRSGMAAALPAMCCYVLGVLGAYHLGAELTRDRRTGALAAIAFGANPNMLYLQTTAMMESSIAMALVCAAAGLARFARTGQFRDVVVAGLLGSLATWTHYGAWALPVYGSLVIGVICWRRGENWRKVETFMLAYAFACGYLPFLWMAWGFYLQGDPIYFVHYHQAVAESTTDPAFTYGRPGNLAYALLNYGLAVLHVLGPVVTGFVLAVLIVGLFRRRFVTPVGPALAAGGFAVTVITAHGGSIGSPLFAQLADLTSIQANGDNIRYGLWMAPFGAAAVALSAGNQRWRQLGVAALLVVGLAWFLPPVQGVDTLSHATERHSNASWQRVADALKAKYDGGRILMSSINGGDRIVWRSGLHASQFITEFNNRSEPSLFELARRQPETHARWILLSPRGDLALTPQRLYNLGYVRMAYYDDAGDDRLRYSLWRQRSR
jgi:hypothetical protein